MMARPLIIICLVFIIFSCKKEWEQPVIYTANLSLTYQPDSVDGNLVYYYPDGMKLQIHFKLISDEGTIKDEVSMNQKNYHWENMNGVKITGEVINLSSDTSLPISNYPLIMRVFEDSKILYEEEKVVNQYTF
jgi:hypothetical protein